MSLNSSIRLQALAETALMDTLPEETFDRLTRMAARIVNAPVALFSLVDGNRQFFKSALGLPMPVALTRQTPLSHSFCQHVVMNDAPLVVDDAAQHPELSHNLAVRDMGVNAYLGIPVRSPDGQTIGSFCAIDTKARHWEADEVLAMEDLAAMLMTELTLREEIARRDDTEARLKLLSREMSHRVKNVFSLTSGLVSISAHDDVTKGFAQKIAYRLQALAQAQDYVQAHDGDGPKTLDGLLRTLVVAYPPERFEIAAMPFAVGDNAGTVFALVMHELATNAIKYGALSQPQGRVHISVQDDLEEILVIRWKETGGPAVTSVPGQNGFGHSMIGRSMKVYLGGDVRYQWQPDGLDVSIQMKKIRLST